MRRGGRRSLSAIEVAEAAALGDLAAAVYVVGRLLGPLGPLGIPLAAFPLAVLGYRRRIDAAAAGVLVAMIVAFLGGGLLGLGRIAVVGIIGAAIGIGARRGRPAAVSALMTTVIVALPVSAVGVGLLAAVPRLRELVLGAITTVWRGVATIAGAAGVPGGVLRFGDSVAAGITTAWWVVLPLVFFAAVFVATTVVGAVLRRPLLRPWPPTEASLPEVDGEVDGGTGQAAGPIPVSLSGVGVRWPGAAAATPSGVDLELVAGRFVTVLGPNGSGKSTLGRVLAGCEPTEGVVHRAGAVGLGATGGTALVLQRPESQVLGVRVVDDVLWGTHTAPDVDAVLARVGLDGMAERETATLSGGELARLALAALLARRPSLVISDESTAMLDPDGRDAMLALLAGLARDGAGVVHITHHAHGSDAEDTLRLGAAPDETAPAETASPSPVPAVDGGRLCVRGVEVVRDAGTPWTHRVLSGFDLDVAAGATILLTGPNGAGKSTLAAVLAGVLTPTAGTVRIDDEPVRNGRGGALLGLQHARLALLRNSVAEDVADAAGEPGSAAVDEALAAVGLAPDLYRDRVVDELSGGEQRRVLLAGLLAARPRVLVLDEPLANLDGDARAAVHATLARLRAAGLTLVVTTHDTDELTDLADAAPGERGRARARTLLRTLPGDSPARRLWAGTKLGIALVTTAVAVAVPTWPVFAGAVAVLVVWALAGRVPRSAWPRPPIVLLLWLPLAVVTMLGGTPPTVMVGSLSLGLGGLSSVALLFATTLVSVVVPVLLVWTTPTGDFPPLVARLARRIEAVRRSLPRRRSAARTPRWPVAVALGLRMTPILLDELTTMVTMLGQRRRSRASRERRSPRAVLALIGSSARLVATAALRRASEVADAITARGGMGEIAGPDARPGRADLVAVLVVVVILGTAIAL